MAVDLSMPVLIVDDMRTVAQIIRNLLIQIGFREIDHVGGGAEALGQLETKKYGLIISDWNMDQMSGLELLQKVRSDARHRKTPFIMVSGEAKAEFVIRARNAGVNNYIVKPFTLETLKDKIDKAMLHDPAPAK